MKKRDMLVLAIVLLAAAAAALLYLPKRNAGTSGARVLVYLHDKVYKDAALSEDQLIEVDQGGGMVNRVRIEGGRVWMESSTCENQDCVHQGKLSPDSIETRVLRDWIICLPNGVSVLLKTGGE